MRKLVGVLTASLLLSLAIPSFAANAAGQAFTDVPANHWGDQAVNLLAEKGIVEGTGKGAVYEGQRPMTRYEVAMALARMLDVVQGMINEGKNVEAIKKAIMNDPEVRNVLKGDKGVDGKNGKDGANGANGNNGTNGKDGVNGKDGAPGKDGVNGANGTNGKDGVNGTNGKDGANGKDGLNGKDGKAGEKGEPGETKIVNAQGQTVSTLTDAQKATLDSASKFLGSYTSIDALNKLINAPKSAGVTEDEKATLVKVKELLNQYGPELSKIRSDIRALEDEVNKLKGASGKKGTAVTISIAGGMRYGLQGTSLTLNKDTQVAADDLAIFNAVGAPNSDLTLEKDVLKGTRYGVYTSDIKFDAKANDKFNANVTMRVISPLQVTATPYSTPASTLSNLPHTYYYKVNTTYPNAGADSYTNPDAISVWEWYGEYSSNIFGKDVQTTFGRKAVNVGSGLLIDTARAPQVNITADTTFNDFTVEGSIGLLDKASNQRTYDPANVEDTYSYLASSWKNDDLWALKNVDVTGGLLISGLGSEIGISLDGSATIPFGGRNVFFNVANMFKKAGDDGSAYAFVLGGDLVTSEDVDGLKVTAKYGKLSQTYRPVFSALYPYAAINAFDTNWIDRAMFLDPENVTTGWELNANYDWKNDYSFGLRMYLGNHVTWNTTTLKTNTEKADTCTAISVKKKINDSVTANLVYARRGLNLEKLGSKSYNVIRLGMDFAL